MANMVQLIKKAAIDAVNESKPATVITGIVKTVNPISVQIDQKLSLTSDFLIVPRSLLDYEVTIEIDGADKQCKVKNSLKIGDNVILIQSNGGQQFTILDRR